MTSILDDLKSLLENTPNYGSLYEWYVVDRDDMLSYEKACEQSLSQWIKSVEAVLELGGKVKELEIWRNATSTGEDEEAHKLILRQTISKLENKALPESSILDTFRDLLEAFDAIEGSYSFFANQQDDWIQGEQVARSEIRKNFRMPSR